MGLIAPLVPRLQEIFAERIVASHSDCGDETIVIRRDDALDTFRALRDRPEFAFEFLMDETCVDRLGETPRFEVVCHLASLTHGHRLRVKVGIPEEDPVMPSLVPVWKSANWLEREAWDMFGIRFDGHPDLRRILLYDSFVGHPLRKDYPVNKRQPIVSERDPIATDWKFS
ncbi:MAG TPA: NADH-quinone oxidoreductase subunit C [Candidatus Binatia bacterium]|nr:NADH-quinone oxidoreductase subunit C [Candidatus Binatia bacterium]